MQNLTNYSFIVFIVIVNIIIGITCAKTIPSLFPRPNGIYESLNGGSISFSYVSLSGPAKFQTYAQMFLNQWKDQKRCKDDCLMIRIISRTKKTEWYRIKTQDGEISLECDFNGLGCFWGIQGIRQLIQDREKNGMFQFPSLVLEDSPLFAWRGFMIDTARHYLPVATIKKVLTGMSLLKLNVMHWHAVDAESFPMVILGAPLLHQKGAYSPKAIYNEADVKEVVSFATQLGIRVVVEFDVPGHSYSWGKGYPEIVAKCPSFEHNINNIPLNPVKNETYQILEEVVKQSSQLFSDQYMHFGGDEVVMGCWKQDPTIQAWMQKQGWTDYSKLATYFHQKLSEIYTKYNKSLMCWQELADTVDLPTDQNVIVQVWKDQTDVSDYSKYKVINSAGFYMNLQTPKAGQPRAAWIDTWQDFYLNPFSDSAVIGGEATMFAETIDENNIIPFAFPRLIAVSERLWTKDRSTDMKEVGERMEKFRCEQMIQKGFTGVGPVIPSFCDAN